MYIVNIYASSNHNVSSQMLESIYSDISDSSILMGDLNSHHPIWDESPVNTGGKAINDFILGRDIVVMNDDTATLFQPLDHNTSSIDITLVSSNLAASSAWCVLPDCGNSDHFSTLLQTYSNFNYPLSEDFILKPFTARNFHKADWSLFYEKVSREIPFSQNPLDFNNLNRIINVAAEAAANLQ